MMVMMINCHSTLLVRLVRKEEVISTRHKMMQMQMMMMMITCQGIGIFKGPNFLMFDNTHGTMHQGIENQDGIVLSVMEFYSTIK